ncbi:apolipoprotein N-acyltransferase [Aeromicrobium sp. SORGH_AS981]|uniref:apolipoprotein N-acyltransferase n=1 Tax=Aeromicrobium sp. SORGH_AS_0981 TaxID=3041802 RepID=UPI002863AD28|nr:apolipoprotein N-acyltransferase [Aeromicrobium sp. SORGH_AS_0981]MDR6119513.1 apolipoprotein N-acyltransferase [Aeromicrobium sp. SORGH_AS_0981]
MRWWLAAPCAAVAGLLSAAAFDPWSVPYAMIVGVALLVWVLRRQRDARVAAVLLSGALYGAAFMGPLIWWMNAVSSGAYVALVAAQVVMLAIIAVPLRAALRLPGWPLWGAAAWVLGEQVRSGFPFSGFPWGRLAHTAIDTPLAPYARLVGMPGTSALLFLLAAMLVVLAGAGIARRSLAVGVVVAVVVAGLFLPSGLAGAGPERRIAAVQGNTPGAFLTWPRGEIGALHLAETQRYADAVSAGTERAPDLVVWPENALDVDPFADPVLAGRIQALVQQLGAPILVGAILDGLSDRTAYNAGIVWDGDGPGEVYVKRKLVPYGEYVPFRRELGELVPRIDRDIPRDMLPGRRAGDLRAGSVVVGDTICWDIAYDGVVEQAVRGGAEVLVVQTSNASFTGTSQPDQQFKISRLRAIETGRWVVVPSTNGISGIIDASGRVVAEAPREQPATLVADVGTATGQTPATRAGRWPAVALMTLGLLGWVLGARDLRRSRRREHA